MQTEEKPGNALVTTFLIARQMAIKINNEQKWIFYWQLSKAIKSLEHNGK